MDQIFIRLIENRLDDEDELRSNSRFRVKVESWEVTSFDSRSMKVQLDFSDPKLVSFVT